MGNMYSRRARQMFIYVYILRTQPTIKHSIQRMFEARVQIRKGLDWRQTLAQNVIHFGLACRSSCHRNLDHNLRFTYKEIVMFYVWWFIHSTGIINSYPHSIEV